MGRTRGGGVGGMAAIVGLVGRWDINFQLYARCGGWCHPIGSWFYHAPPRHPPSPFLVWLRVGIIH